MKNNTYFQQSDTTNYIDTRNIVFIQFMSNINYVDVYFKCIFLTIEKLDVFFFKILDLIDYNA